MKKIAISGLVLFSLACGSYSPGLYRTKSATTATAAAAATCENAVADQATETKLEQDPKVSDETVCANRKSFGQKYKGLTCNFSQTQQNVAIQPVDCDPSVVHDSRAQTLAEKSEIQATQVTTSKKGPE